MLLLSIYLIVIQSVQRLHLHPRHTQNYVESLTDVQLDACCQTHSVNMPSNKQQVLQGNAELSTSVSHKRDEEAANSPAMHVFVSVTNA